MMYLVSNPTHRGKAVRSAGGLLTVAAGTTASIDADWDPELVAKYRAAGLEVVSAEEGETTPSSDSDTTPASSRADLLRSLAATFPEGSEEHWMRDGRPQVAALNELLPEGAEPFSAAERDAIWSSL